MKRDLLTQLFQSVFLSANICQKDVKENIKWSYFPINLFNPLLFEK